MVAPSERATGQSCTRQYTTPHDTHVCVQGDMPEGGTGIDLDIASVQST